MLSVGGGSAGCVLANRLSEDGSAKVLLLEAGDDDAKMDIIDLPLSTQNLLTTGIDWKYQTVPQRHCCSGYKDKVKHGYKCKF